jgi:Mg2+ and Co2+ transporter CorA
LFGLLTHEDASSSISLANSSKELSEAAKKDSSAMKTIAVMTMAFLPGTFFAALFAVPSLKWDQPSVIQDNFWIYWAFTLPSTALVFLAWFSIMQRRSILKMVSKAVDKKR